MGGCQPSKLHIDNAGNMRTANDIQYPSLRSSGDSFEIRAPQDVNQRSRMHNFQGQGDPMKIESEAYQLNLEDLDESPQTSETSAQTNFPRDHMKPVSACYTGKVKNSLYVSKKGRKVYESSYPKISA